MSEHTRNGKWGTNAIEIISQQLQKELPGLRGFSAAAIRKMRIFYEQWQPIFENHSPAVNETVCTTQMLEINSLTNRSLAVNDLQWDMFLSIGFTHHYEILAKTTTLEERIFYIRKAAENHWSKDKLIDEFIQGYDNPMGVATYKTKEEIRRVLPSEEDLQYLLSQD